MSSIVPDHVVSALQSSRALELEDADQASPSVELSMARQALERARERAIGTVLPGLKGEAGDRVRDRFDQASADYDRALTAAEADVHAAAVRQGRIEWPRLRRSAELLGESLETLQAIPSGAKRTLLNVPFQIVTTPGLTVEQSQMVPSGSFTRFKFDTNQRSGSQSVQFDYFWQNLSGKTVVLDILGMLMFSGHLQVRSSGGFFAGDRYCRADLEAKLKVVEFFNSPAARVVESASALALYCSSGSMFGDAASKSATVFRGFGLQGHLLIVPTDGVLVFTMEALLRHRGGQNGSTRVRADFASGDFRVMSPAVLVITVS